MFCGVSGRSGACGTTIMNTAKTAEKGGQKTERNIAKIVTARLARATRRRAQQQAAAAPLEKMNERSECLVGFKGAGVAADEE